MSHLQNKLQKIADDTSLTAKSVGLRYFINHQKGYNRFRAKTTFYYLDEKENRVLNEISIYRFSASEYTLAKLLKKETLKEVFA
jgi:hypothetical protein